MIMQTCAHCVSGETQGLLVTCHSPSSLIIRVHTQLMFTPCCRSPVSRPRVTMSALTRSPRVITGAASCVTRLRPTTTLSSPRRHLSRRPGPPLSPSPPTIRCQAPGATHHPQSSGTGPSLTTPASLRCRPRPCPWQVFTMVSRCPPPARPPRPPPPGSPAHIRRPRRSQRQTGSILKTPASSLTDTIMTRCRPPCPPQAWPPWPLAATTPCTTTTTTTTATTPQRQDISGN